MKRKKLKDSKKKLTEYKKKRRPERDRRGRMKVKEVGS